MYRMHSRAACTAQSFHGRCITIYISVCSIITLYVRFNSQYCLFSFLIYCMYVFTHIYS